MKPPINFFDFKEFSLKENETSVFPFTHVIATNPSNPYWLDRSIDQKVFGIYNEGDDLLTSWVDQYGMPVNVPKVDFKYTLNIAGVDIEYTQAIDYKWEIMNHDK